jgi:aminopeptidase N
MERAGGRDLGWYFDQWLTRGDLPALEGTWAYDAARGGIVLTLRQLQTGPPYRLAVDVAVHAPGAAPTVSRVEITERAQDVLIPSAAAPDSVAIDPGVRLLTAADVTVKAVSVEP